jgi:hypothetical protein
MSRDGFLAAPPGNKKAGSKNHHTRRIASACLPEKTGAKALCLFMLRGTAKAVP